MPTGPYKNVFDIAYFKRGPGAGLASDASAPASPAASPLLSAVRRGDVPLLLPLVWIVCACVGSGWVLFWASSCRRPLPLDLLVWRAPVTYTCSSARCAFVRSLLFNACSCCLSAALVCVAVSQEEAKSAADLPPTPGRVPVAIHLGYAGEFDKKA